MNLKLTLDMTPEESTVILPKIAALMDGSTLEATSLAEAESELPTTLPVAQIADLPPANDLKTLAAYLLKDHALEDDVRELAIKRLAVWLSDPEGQIDAEWEYLENSGYGIIVDGASPFQSMVIGMVDDPYHQFGYFPNHFVERYSRFFRALFQGRWTDHHKDLLRCLYKPKASTIAERLSQELQGIADSNAYQQLAQGAFARILEPDRDRIVVMDIYELANQSESELLKYLSEWAELPYSEVQEVLLTNKDWDEPVEEIGFKLLITMWFHWFRTDNINTWVPERFLLEDLNLDSPAQLYGIIGGFGRRIRSISGPDSYDRELHGDIIEQRQVNGEKQYRLQDQLYSFLQELEKGYRENYGDYPELRDVGIWLFDNYR